MDGLCLGGPVAASNTLGLGKPCTLNYARVRVRALLIHCTHAVLHAEVEGMLVFCNSLGVF